MCRVFSPARAVLSVFLLNYFRPKAGKRRKGDKACKLAAASYDLLHFKPELTPNYWKSHLSDDGFRSVRCCSISSPNLSFIPRTFFEKIHAEIMHTAFSIWSVPNSATRRIRSMEAVSNSPINGLRFWTVVDCRGMPSADRWIWNGLHASNSFGRRVWHRSYWENCMHDFSMDFLENCARDEAQIRRRDRATSHRSTTVVR